MQIAGMVDWEFTYAAPVEFSYAPPWWLLIENPKLWPNGIDDWEKIVYAALNGLAFDAIYWEKIDPFFFEAAQRPETAWKERLSLLGEKDIEEMEKLVVRKLEEMKTRILKWDPDEYTVEAIAKAAEVDGAQ
ncbi:Aminoglycoside phosphotransferase [Penicillium concentricum]|uniref:Aminoglycoside phosphotransferase n=1 Tax=Penicillium concentricum TaxID=293559 RepID=A0A9W9V9U5_9EURO|nr:Aminoglycoside phosphotransferase [Penicillium concentricum]KAJ5372894.1 Aminoglycoside phosphotransferase [Penicillium concentricum]